VSDDFSVEFTARSRKDLQQAREWLTQPGSGRQAHLRYLSILKALSDLSVSPFRWPISDHVGFRKRPIEGYRIFYSIDGARRMVVVRRILGPGQDTNSL
jgi:mRNA-degrading endonuclease RelE of RelBE toxin-antitoxin system